MRHACMHRQTDTQTNRHTYIRTCPFIQREIDQRQLRIPSTLVITRTSDLHFDILSYFQCTEAYKKLQGEKRTTIKCKSFCKFLLISIFFLNLITQEPILGFLFSFL